MVWFQTTSIAANIRIRDLLRWILELTGHLRCESTLNALLAFSGRELRFRTISEVRRDSKIAPIGEVSNYFNNSP